jgi:NitT/TauT family transport system ATP-binding protein
MNALTTRAWAAETEPLASLTGCTLTLGGRRIIEDLSFEIREGEVLAVVGPSGCGKSSLLRLLAGLLRPDGASQIDARGVARTPAMMFQKPVLMPWLDAERNVDLSLRLGPTRVVDKAERARRTDRALGLVGLREFRHHYPHQLSGGMQQRLALARALVAEPALLLLDEPFGALDELTRAALNVELLRIWESPVSKLATVVLVTHSISEAVLLADRVLVLTPHPARLRAIVDVALPKPRSIHFAELDAHDGFREGVRAVRSEIGLQ